MRVVFDIYKSLFNMNQLKIFIDLIRIKKPIGFMLLFWPCAWGLSFSYNFKTNDINFLYYMFLFFLGSVLMRSAGCIFNDIVDKDIDKKVQRTKKRPLAAGLISVKKSFLYVLFLCLLAFLILIQFNILTIIIGMSSMIFAFSYPYMKRITYWPQLFLGLTFNWGVIMGWTAINNSVSTEIIMLYMAAIFWTLGYDTIYGLQDVKDDEIIGMKSTSIKFKNNPILFIGSCYTLSSLIIIYVFKNIFGPNLSTIIMLIFIISLFYQLFKINSKKNNDYLGAFKINNFSGFALFLSIFLIN